jgi:hypothetical protein
MLEELRFYDVLFPLTLLKTGSILFPVGVIGTHTKQETDHRSHFVVTLSTMMMIWATIVLAIVGSTMLLHGGRQLVLVTVRRARPILCVLLVVAWLVARLLPISLQVPEESLLQIILEYLHIARQITIDYLASSGSTSMLLGAPFLVSKIWRLCEDYIGFLLLIAVYRCAYCLYHYSLNEWFDLVISSTFDWGKENIPGVKNELDKQTESFKADSDDILNKDPQRSLTLVMPESGRSHESILDEIEKYAVIEDEKWKKGKVSGTVYGDDPQHSQLMNSVYALYSWSNPLHPGFWPKLNQCEAEVIVMTANLLNGPPIGCMTSGGTESIILAIRAHLNYYGKRRGIQHAEIICGSTAHAALNKACDMFGIRLVVIDCSGESSFYQLSPSKVRRHVTINTIMIYASAPCYPQGVVDPIEDLSDIAQEFDIGLHVDACLGGFILPFMVDPPVFDFRNKGVTSISADTHKYGFASKGTSVVVFRQKVSNSQRQFANFSPVLSKSSTQGIEARMLLCISSLEWWHVFHSHDCRVSSWRLVSLCMGCIGIHWSRWLPRTSSAHCPGY